MVVPLVILVLLLGFPAAAQAGNETWTTPTSMTTPPPGKQLNLKTVLAKGEATKTVKEMRKKHPNLRALGYLDTATGNWLIRYVIPQKELVEVDINDATAAAPAIAPVIVNSRWNISVLSENQLGSYSKHALETINNFITT